MRITGNRLVDLVTAATQKGEQQVATASDHATSGLRVERPSDDPAAWALARRAADRKTINGARATAITLGRDRLQATDGALATIGDLVARARTFAVQGGNDSLDATARATLATQVTALMQAAVAAGNTKTSDGEYVLAGDASQTAPFDPAGAYQGDAGARAIDAGEGLTQTVGVPGAALTAANGVDVLPSIAALASALATNNVAAIRASIDTLDRAGKQVSAARGDAGAALANLDGADSTRAQLDVTLAGTISNAIEADPVAAATDLARAQTALETAQAVTSHVLALVRPPQT
jgi:flagellar hook-associated protein 3 FlgL